MEQKKRPLGIQTFRKIIREGYLYVDKTREIYDLLSRGGQYYFISRPRRFGKSVMITTLKELFAGEKELFKGLWIYDKIQWKPRPVIHFDFLEVSSGGTEILEKSLQKYIAKIGRQFQVELSPDDYYKDMFVELIREVARKHGNEVVILIDEYDKPIIDYLEQGNLERAAENRNILKSFYSTIKGADEYLKFVLLTGVSKFSKVSIFSDLNNLEDITFDPRHSALMGYTEEQLLQYFPLDGADKNKIDKIKEWYNGYSWDGEHFLYNPYSILLFFEKKVFGNYWFTTGTPSFLVGLLKDKKMAVEQFEWIEADESTLGTFDIENQELTSLLFQTGYLTVKQKVVSTDEEPVYRLSYPNKEVKESFFKNVLKG